MLFVLRVLLVFKKDFTLLPAALSELLCKECAKHVWGGPSLLSRQDTLEPPPLPGSGGGANRLSLEVMSDLGEQSLQCHCSVTAVSC